MMHPIAFYHHAKIKKLLMSAFGENVQNPQFLTLKPLNPIQRGRVQNCLRIFRFTYREHFRELYIENIFESLINVTFKYILLGM